MVFSSLITAFLIADDLLYHKITVSSSLQDEKGKNNSPSGMRGGEKPQDLSEGIGWRFGDGKYRRPPKKIVVLATYCNLYCNPYCNPLARMVPFPLGDARGRMRSVGHFIILPYSIVFVKKISSTKADTKLTFQAFSFREPQS